MRGFALLAVSDTAAFTMWAIGYLLTLGIGGLLALVNARIRKIETIETRLSERNDEAIRDKFKAADELMAAKLETASAQLQAEVGGVRMELKRMNDRLDRGDDEFKDLVNGDHSIELKMMKEVKGISDFVREECASKDDLRELSRRFDGLQQAVAKAMADAIAHPIREGAKV